MTLRAQMETAEFAVNSSLLCKKKERGLRGRSAGRFFRSSQKEILRRYNSSVIFPSRMPGVVSSSSANRRHFFCARPRKKTLPLMVEVAIKIARIGLRKSREFIRRANCVWGTLVWFFSGQKRRLWKLVCIDGGINLTARKLGDRGLPPGWVAFLGGF